MRIDTLTLANDARGRWPGILMALGIDGKFLRDIHGPCPACGGTDRFRFDDQMNGRYYCSQCGPGDGFDLLRKVHGWDFPRAKAEVAAIVGTVAATSAKPERSEEDKRAYMRRMFKESRPVTPGDPVHAYLVRRCGDPSAVLQDLRFHPALKHSMGGQHPAMLALMGWDGTRFNGIHRTYLTTDGRKADVDPVRMSYGDLGPVRLGPVSERMGIAEGIETAICAGLRFGMPVWSAISAHGLESWTPPEGVREVWIFGDNDESCTGQAAAWALAKRLKREGLAVDVRIPERVGTDWADVVMQEVA